jgi:hypothetical protein
VLFRSDLIGATMTEYTIDRLGIIRAVKLQVPSGGGTSIEDHHLIGVEDACVQVGNIPPLASLTLKYDRNNTVQTPGDLDATLSGSGYDTYGTELSTYQATNTISDYPNPLTEVVEIGAFRGTIATLGTNEKTFRSVERSIWRVRASLSLASLTSDFGLGSMVSLDFDHEGFDNGDDAMVIGRRVNWSNRTQELTVLKTS